MSRQDSLFSRIMCFCESAMKATPSAPCSTTRRVELCITWPGTVNSFTLMVKPEDVLKNTGMRSKNRVRSSDVSSTINRPRVPGDKRLWTAWRLVVLPDRAGP